MKSAIKRPKPRKPEYPTARYVLWDMTPIKQRFGSTRKWMQIMSPHGARAALPALKTARCFARLTTVQKAIVREE